MNVSVRDLKAQLSRYLRDARAGHDVVVTSHGRPVVRLLPIRERSGQEPTNEDLLFRLKLIPGVQVGTGGKPSGAKKPLRIRPGQQNLAQTVLENRN